MMLAELRSFVQQNQRVCPLPDRWHELWKMLPDRRRVGAGWQPPLALKLGAWWDTPILAKRLRLLDHLDYAAERGVLARVDVFLRSLPEDQWAHVADFKASPAV